MRPSTMLRLVLPAIALAVLAGCATGGGAAWRTPTADAYAEAAVAAIAQGRLDVALEQLDKATRLSPARADLWLRLATLRSDTGQHAAAAHAAAQALVAAPDDAAARAQLAHSSLRLAATTLDPATREGAVPLARADLDGLVAALRGAVGDEALVPEAMRAELAALRAKAEKPPRCVPTPAPEAKKPDPLRALGNGE